MRYPPRTSPSTQSLPPSKAKVTTIFQRSSALSVSSRPPRARLANSACTEVADFAAQLGVPGIATHIGFVPEDDHDPDYIAVRELVRRVCDHAATLEQTFALETGQERAEVLLDFIHDVNRDNLGINFDPANMILYGTGDPIEALGILAAHILSVHCKDGNWPKPGRLGALGTEVALGQGAVNIEKVLTPASTHRLSRPPYHRTRSERPGGTPPRHRSRHPPAEVVVGSGLPLQVF